MSEPGFRALVARKDGKEQTVRFETLMDADLPQADVTVDVEYSSFNYKDGLALKGLSRILRSYPIVPGIDFAGTVSASESDRFRPGDKVILTGWGVGESWSGGFAERARVKSDWLVKLPDGLDTKQAMAIGTAGLTAMLSVMALERFGLRPGGDVLVTGAAGGVGSVGVRLLAKAGYSVTALTGRRSEEGVPARARRGGDPGSRRIRAARQAAGRRAVARRDRHRGRRDPRQRHRRHGARWAVAACGLAASTDLPATVFPFILRGVALLGIDSVQCPRERREEAWRRLAREFDARDFESVTEVIGLDDLPARADAILAGKVRGRTVVQVRGDM